MHPLLKRLRDMGLVPLVMPSLACEPSQAFLTLGKALMEAPLPLAVLPLRNAADEDALRRLTSTFPDLLVGACGVASIHQVTRAQAAGARFVLTTGFSGKVVSWCVENDMLILPGCSTASEVESARDMGLSAVTFYPADLGGRLDTLHALHEAYPDMFFVPAGALDADAVSIYLECPAVLACATTCCADENLMASGNTAAIARSMTEAVRTMLDMRLGHIGVYPDAQSDAATQTLVNEFVDITRDPVKDIGPGVFVGSGIEVLKITSDTWKGHIAYDVSCVDRACAHLALRGIQVDESTARRKADGLCFFIYLVKPVGHFGVHLRNRKL